MIKGTIFTMVLWMGILFTTVSPVMAQQGSDLCSVFGILCEAVSGDPGSVSGEDATNYVLSLVGMVLSLIFVLIIVVAVFIIIKSGVKYIQSQGDTGDIEAANKAMKNVFIGIALLFVSIIGIILLLAFFGGTNLLGSNVNLQQLLRPGT